MPDPATIVIKAHPSAIKHAREFIAMVFDGWGLRADDACTVVGELAANAVTHGSTEGDLVVIRAYLLNGRPVVEAWDRSDRPPVAGVPAPLAESGRGLLIMGTLVRNWGCRPLNGGGKVVYAELDAVPV
ncbi:ATP-binding protein [Actinomadura viridis]|uniref:ATP-binding protein n=1 Tax=Actinomadura viridis TaxID=58110 RepID=UPI0036907908